MSYVNMKTTLLHGNCLELLPTISDSSIDLVLADPPYGVTYCAWDSVIPLEPLWVELKRVLKPNGAVVMTAGQPFTTILIASNMKMFKYCWVWDKRNHANFASMKWMPGKVHEDIVVFYRKTPTYNPIRQPRSEKSLKQRPAGAEHIKCVHEGQKWAGKNVAFYNQKNGLKKTSGVAPADGMKNPTTIISINRPSGHEAGKHPTQKPIALMEYFIRTYTNEGDTVLDFCMGSGTTEVACANTCREFIGIEPDPAYFEIAADRIRTTPLSLALG